MTVEDELLITMIELEIAVLNLIEAASLTKANLLPLRERIREEAELGFRKLSFDQKQQLLKIIFSRTT